MEFLDEEPRPRFILQSRAPGFPYPSSSSPVTETLNKLLILICFSISISLFILALLFLHSQTVQFFVIWSASSLLLAPFAPPSLTAGDIRVGRGRIVEFRDQDRTVEFQESNDKVPVRRSRARKSVNLGPGSHQAADLVNPPMKQEEKTASADAHRNGNDSGKDKALLDEDEIEEEYNGEEREWNDDDVGLLRKQMLKHPVGKSGRWETIAEAFRGKHKVGSVIKMAKALGEKRAGNGDDYSQFLRNRKPLDARAEVEAVGDGVGPKWTSGEDIALLNALKAFPKDASMRWDKVAAAVPGRSKAACMKRFGELKKGFRNSKASAETS